MQTVTNTKLVESRGTWGKRLAIVGFVMLFAAVFMPLKDELLVFSWPVMIIGFVISNIGMFSYNKYGRPPLPHDLLDKALKGVDSRYRLYNYTTAVPHVLLTPFGVMVIVLRRMGGDIACQGEKWQAKTSFLSKLRIFTEDQVGNPALDLRQDVNRLQTLLETKLSSADGDKPVPLSGFVFFSHPDAKLTLDQPTVPVLSDRNVKDYLRRQSGEKLSPARYDEIAAVLEG